MDNFDPLSAMEPLLESFERDLRAVSSIEDLVNWTEVGLQLAKLGAAASTPTAYWSEESEALIRHRLAGELSLKALSYYEDEAQPLSAFSCYALGFFLEKLQSGQISDPEFLLADMLIPGFVDLNMNRICGIYDGATWIPDQNSGG